MIQNGNEPLRQKIRRLEQELERYEMMAHEFTHLLNHVIRKHGSGGVYYISADELRKVASELKTVRSERVKLPKDGMEFTLLEESTKKDASLIILP